MGIDEEKGYFSIDAVFALLILVAVSSTFLVGARQSRVMARETSTQIEQKMALEKIAAGVNKVYANGYRDDENFELKLDMKENILKNNQRIQVDVKEGFLYVKNLDDNSISPIKASIIPLNVENFSLDSDDMSKKLRIFWGKENIRIEPVEGW